MNKRQAKKRKYKKLLFYQSYKKDKIIKRKEHINSIRLARKNHRNYWEEWSRGYPNRFPYGKWFNSMTPNFMIQHALEECRKVKEGW